MSPSTALLGILVLPVLVLAVGEAVRRPPHRVLPPAIHGSLVLVPIGDVPADRLAELPPDYASEYGLTVTLAAPIPLDPLAFDAGRNQFTGEDLLTSLERLRPIHPEAVIIGITQSDIRLRAAPHWNWAFAARGDRAAVVSVARMPDARFQGRWWLMRKMLTRQVGFLCFGLDPTGDRYDLLFRDILGVPDLRRVSGHL